MASTEEQIKKMYQSQLDSQKEQLKQDYMQADADLTAQKAQAQKATDANLNRTMVEAQKAAVSNAELRNASGLSSGTAAQARLSESNQLQSDLTALRVQQQEVDAEAERQRSLLAQEYASAIRQAQAENDLAKAQALYEEAQRQEDALRTAKQQAASADATSEYALAAAKLMAEETGDYTRLAQIYGLSAAELATLMGTTPENGTGAGGSGNENDAVGSGGEGTEITEKFLRTALTKQELARQGAVKMNGQTVTNYADYIRARLDEWAEGGIPGSDGTALSNAELAWLVKYYGLV